MLWNNWQYAGTVVQLIVRSSQTKSVSVWDSGNFKHYYESFQLLLMSRYWKHTDSIFTVFFWKWHFPLFSHWKNIYKVIFLTCSNTDHFKSEYSSTRIHKIISTVITHSNNQRICQAVISFIEQGLHLPIQQADSRENILQDLQNRLNFYDKYFHSNKKLLHGTQV